MQNSSKRTGTVLRLTAYSTGCEEFICDCVQRVADCGRVTDGLENPAANMINECLAALGSSFSLTSGYITEVLSIYLGRPAAQLKVMADTFLQTLLHLKGQNKSESILKNTLVKFMYWTRIAVMPSFDSALSGKNPLIVSSCTPSRYELIYFKAICTLGYDVLLVVREGEDAYKKADTSGAYSRAINVSNAMPFPAGFDVRNVKASSQTAPKSGGIDPVKGGALNLNLGSANIQQKREPAKPAAAPSAGTTGENRTGNDIKPIKGGALNLNLGSANVQQAARAASRPDTPVQSTSTAGQKPSQSSGINPIKGGALNLNLGSANVQQTPPAPSQTAAATQQPKQGSGINPIKGGALNLNLHSANVSQNVPQQTSSQQPKANSGINPIKGGALNLNLHSANVQQTPPPQTGSRPAQPTQSAQPSQPANGQRKFNIGIDRPASQQPPRPQRQQAPAGGQMNINVNGLPSQRGRQGAPQSAPSQPDNRQFHFSTGKPSAKDPRDYIQNFCTNAWLTGEIFEDIRKPVYERGQERGVIYNAYVRVNGVEKRSTYLTDLSDIYTKEREKRNVCVIDKPLDLPSNQETAQIIRGNYRDIYGLINDMSRNFVHSSAYVQDKMQRAFGAVMMDMYEFSGDLRKVMNQAVYLACYVKHFQGEIYSGMREGSVSLCIFFGGCPSEREALLAKFLARTPVDVLVLRPRLETNCTLADPLLYERNFPDSVMIDSFPKQNGRMQMGTAAYYAERDLDGMMYTNTGMYRDHQFSKAQVIVLRTMYEEIAQLWQEEIKMRPNFSVKGDTVCMPVFFAKVSGVKDGNMEQYWESIASLITVDTLVFRNCYIIPNPPPSDHTPQFFNKGHIVKDRVKRSRFYQYGYLKDSIQDYILDGLDDLLQKGIFSNEGGLAYRAAAIALALPPDILRRLQTLDLTKGNPKIIYINTTENTMTIDDSIFLALMCNLGYDVLMFLPTGYVATERYCSPAALVNHEIGNYMFDQQIPDLNAVARRVAEKKKKGFFGKLFGKK